MCSVHTLTNSGHYCPLSSFSLIPDTNGLELWLPVDDDNVGKVMVMVN